MSQRAILVFITLTTFLSCTRQVPDELPSMWSGGAVLLEFLDKSTVNIYSHGYLVGTGNYKISKQEEIHLEYQNSIGQLENWLVSIEDNTLFAQLPDGRGLYLNRQTSPIEERAYVSTQAITTVSVDPTVKWTNSGIELEINQDVEIVVSGNILVGDGTACGPDGCERPMRIQIFNRLGEYPHGCLLGKISGSSEIFYVGDHQRFKAASEGVLLLGVNDTARGNNSGIFLASIKVGMKEFEISASTYWQDTGIEMRPGKEVVLEVSGSINVTKKTICEASGCESFSLPGHRRYPSFQRGLLVAKIGKSSIAFPVGSRLRFKSLIDGNLYFGINDKNMSDNSGSFKVAADWSRVVPRR